MTGVPKFYIFITLWSWLHFYDTHLCNFVASNKLRVVFPVACCRTIDVTTFNVHIYPLRILHSWIIYHNLGCYHHTFRFFLFTVTAWYRYSHLPVYNYMYLPLFLITIKIYSKAYIPLMNAREILYLFLKKPRINNVLQRKLSVIGWKHHELFRINQSS